ncbi:MAG: YdcF family protein [Oscillospiraceae bacterium]|nr:YdcF family protein [Oscillospiraceae bacterium]
MQRRGQRAGLQLLAAALLWLCVFAAWLCIGGGGLTLFYEIPPEATGQELAVRPEGIVRVTESRPSADGTELAIRMESVGRGVAEATISWDGLGEDSLYEQEISSTIYALAPGFLFDSITWNFSGWEVFTACLSFFLLTAALIFYFAYRREKKRVYFSYRATADLGLAIFFLVTSLLRLDMLMAFLRGENAGTVWSLLVGTIVTAQTFMRRTAFVIAGFAVLVAASNLVLMRHEGTRPSNMLGIAVSVLMVGGAALGIWMSRSLLTFPLRNVLLNVYAGLFVYVECLLAATVIRAVEAGRHEPDYDRDYVLVLGCKIRPDGTLYPLIRGRVDRAIDFVNAQRKATGKQAVLIPSGGQGSDEPMAEAEAMARYMRQRGIPEEYILPEDRSKTTRENLLFSRKLIGEGEQPVKAAFSTSSYHVYRGGILAAEDGWDLDGMGSSTKWYFWPNAFLREFIGLMAAGKARQLLAAAVITMVSAGLTMLVM